MGGLFNDPYPPNRFDTQIYVKVSRIRRFIFVNSFSNGLFRGERVLVGDNELGMKGRVLWKNFKVTLLKK